MPVFFCALMICNLIVLLRLRRRFPRSGEQGLFALRFCEKQRLATLLPLKVVAPEKPPITQRPQGLDVCSGVPEL
ncbi:hypothetical protein QYY87_21540, partial [Xanthomonas campestris pv. campestris]